jgi:hypothetical protein
MEVGGVSCVMVRKFDDAIIDIFTDGYLWLWDRTGIYLATIMFWGIILFTGISLITSKLPVLDIIIALVWIIMILPYYIFQKEGNLTVVNSMSRRWRYSFGRSMAYALQIGMLVGGFYMGDNHLPITLSVWLVQYLLCVQIRDREPKSFFEMKLQGQT